MPRSYTLSDLVKYSGATRNQVQNWVQKSVIVPDLASTSGTGEHREFGFRDVFEAAVARRLNQIPGGIPTRELSLALDAIRAEEPSSRRDRERRAALRKEQLDSLKPEDAGDAWLLGFFLSMGPAAEFQSWRLFVDPKRRDARAQFWLLWEPRLGFSAVVDNKETLNNILGDLDVLVVVNIGNVLIELERQTEDFWAQADDDLEANPDENPFQSLGLPERARVK